MALFIKFTHIVGNYIAQTQESINTSGLYWKNLESKLDNVGKEEKKI